MEKIIIIDDDEDFGPLIESFLKDSNYEVIFLNDIPAAVTFLMEIDDPNTIKGIYCDHNLKTGTGLELCEFLYRYKYPVPFVPISAQFETKDTIEYLNFGAAFILEKGFNKEKFLSSIEKIEKTDLKYAKKNKSKRSILIVDDEIEIIELLKESLEELNINVFTSNNVMEAIEIFDKNKISLVITDLKMAPYDGIYLAKHIWEKKPKFPIISITAFQSKFEESGIKPTDFLNVFNKPFSCGQIVSAVETELLLPH